MSNREIRIKILPRVLAVALSTSLALASSVQAAMQPQAKASSKQVAVKKATVPTPPASNAIEFAPQITATLGKSTVLRLPVAASRISVGNPAIADVTLLSPKEIYLLGKTVGSTNIIFWNKEGQSTVVDVTVGMDTVSLQGKLRQFMPGEQNIRVDSAADTIVLSGVVTDAVKAARAVLLAEAYAGKKVVNLMSIGSVQQVMLEVKIAEINRTELDRLGFNFARLTGGSFLYGILGGNVGISTVTNNATPANSIGVAPGIFGTGVGGTGTVAGSADQTSFLFDAQKKDGLVKILAEPNIVAISGQEGSFLAGGEILIPVPQANGTIGLESKLFGVGLRFTPTVLDGGRIQMRVQPEVTDLVGFTSVASTGLGSSTLVPTLTTRRISTAVELLEGQSLAIGGLLQDNVRESINRFPILGEIPILGALFRSSEFQKNKTELLIVVTPRLVKPLAANFALPTDAFKPPTRAEILLGGKLEGDADEPAGQTSNATTKPAETKPKSGPSGFEMK